VTAHVVMFRFRPEVPTTEREALAASFEHTVKAIPSVRRARVGSRLRLGRGYEALMKSDYPYIAILEFDDREGLLAYLEHPAHAGLGTRFFELFEDALIYDFELADDSASLSRMS
jgi:hypothetical protein